MHIIMTVYTFSFRAVGGSSINTPAAVAGGSTGGFVFLLITFSIFLMMYLASHSIKYYLKWRLREPECEYSVLMSLRMCLTSCSNDYYRDA